jgi:hypothetical protein
LFDDNLEVKEVDYFGDFNLDLTINGPIPSALNLRVGNGTNIVRFGGTAKQIDQDFLQAQIFGGTGEDTVIFDDSKGNKTVTRDYSITPSSFMNQLFFGVEKAEIKTRLNVNAAANTVFMTGAGAVQNAITFSNNRHHRCEHTHTIVDR